ncbi:hypothetical protein JCM12294_29560 [Desulfocicer niacini]
MLKKGELIDRYIHPLMPECPDIAEKIMSTPPELKIHGVPCRFFGLCHTMAHVVTKSVFYKRYAVFMDYREN